MECPICRSVFSKVKEILVMADRSFYCPQCWSRLISFPHGGGKFFIEEDITGEKWKNMRNDLAREKKV